MAFDDKTRGRLQKLVTACRGVLAKDFSIQAQQTYGLDPKTGEVTPLERLTHLSAAERETADLLRQTLTHYLASEGLPDSAAHRVPIIDRIVREQAFTVLNRLAALLMMEARGVLQRPAVGAGQQSPAFELYKMVAGSALGEIGQAYQTFLFSLFDEFAQDLPALFDRFAPQGRLFPREAALLQVLAELNHHEIQPLWAEDETLGWVYQYFNSREERKAMREASQAPRNSRELAVRNQFFTPRYVVEFLVDNTLGRLWFNATGGATCLRERCQYLLVKPDETPQAATKLRDPRTLKLLDPACGSMHFGLYAFDLFIEIYREAWAWEQQHGPGSLDVSTLPQAALKPLCHTFEDEAAFLRNVPRLIIEHNIYGVDIDPRAAQIATLALWLRAQRAWHDAGVKATDRPSIGRGHVIAATAPPAEREQRQQFAATLDHLDAELFEKTLQLLKGLPELGVLLQIERELPHLNERTFIVTPEAFDAVPGKPFAYWVSDAVINIYRFMSALQNDDRIAAIGASTKDDGRFLRLNWEVNCKSDEYPAFAKGGRYSPFYADISLVIRWRCDGAEAKTFVSDYRAARGWSPHWKAELHNPHCYFRPGLTWPRRTKGLSFRTMPRGCIFADKGPAIFVANDDAESLLALCALINSAAFGYLVSLQLARVELAQSFEVGIIQHTPVLKLSTEQQTKLATLAHRAWFLKRTLDTVEETSHAFLLPAALRTRLRDYDLPAIEESLARIQAEIDEIAFTLYGFSTADRAAAQASQGTADDGCAVDDEGDEEGTAAAPADATAGLLSWAVGVAFGRFEWRLATGERTAPAEPDPFDPLPAKSAGMLPDGVAPFHTHSGILVDERGHPHDLARLVEEVLERVSAPVPGNVRRWLQREFFPFHLQRYSKSRRKAPIYWPLSTPSGSYTLWLYYPSLTSQTLYTAINDFVEPKLQQVGAEAAALRTKGTVRTREEEKQFEALHTFEQELLALRDTLLAIAPTYKPHHDDGVQICAAPLWALFRHKPWQKVLKETWGKLERGDYDWAHLAMAYWPDRVREKCKTDKSLAIAHGLEDVSVAPPSPPKAPRARKKARST